MVRFLHSVIVDNIIISKCIASPLSNSSIPPLTLRWNWKTVRFSERVSRLVSHCSSAFVPPGTLSGYAVPGLSLSFWTGWPSISASVPGTRRSASDLSESSTCPFSLVVANTDNKGPNNAPNNIPINVPYSIPIAQRVPPTPCRPYACLESAQEGRAGNGSQARTAWPPGSRGRSTREDSSFRRCFRKRDRFLLR